MGYAESQTPIDGERRLVRLYTDEGQVTYISRYCVLCSDWVDETGGVMRVNGVPMGFVCQYHTED